MAMMRPPIDMSSMSDSGRVVNVQGGNHNLMMNADASPNHKKKGSVQVKLELGHKAITRKKPTPEGFTHDWTMFVRGPEGSNIQHFVDRVIFYLHESFPKPKRVVKEPPYQINESGYAGFNLPIEIYFKNKDDPKKINFSYDLFLHTPHSPPVNHVRCEKLTFQNPSEEFRRKLVKAGGMALLGPADPSQTGSQPSVTQSASPTLTTQPHTPESKAFADLFGAPPKSEKKHKSTSKEKSGGRSKSSSSSQGSSVSPMSGPLMGTPPAAISPPTTPSKEQTKPHTGGSGSKHKDKAGKRPSESASPAESSKKKRKDNDDKDREEKREKEKREKEREKEQQKEQQKERQREEKERKEKEKKEKKDRKASSKESKSKHKSSKKDAVKPPKKGASPRAATSRASPRVASPRVASPQVASPQMLSPQVSPRASSPPLPETSRGVPEVRTLAAKKAPPSSLEDLGISDMYGFDDDLDMNMDIPADIMAAVCSPASTLSFSSMKGQGGEGGGGPLRELFAEMDDDDVPLSPLPLTSDSPPPPPLPPSQLIPKGNPTTTQEPPAPSIEPPTKDISSPPQPDPKPAPGKAKKRGKESRRSRVDRHTKEASKENKDVSKDTTSSTSNNTKNNAKDAIAKDLFKDYQDNKDTEDKTAPSKASAPPNSDLGERDLNNTPQQPPSMVAPNGETLSVLLELQTRLMRMTDRDLVQRVVNVIEETGMYKISDATFDFDLCSLDIHTVKKLQVCLEMVC